MGNVAPKPAPTPGSSRTGNSGGGGGGFGGGGKPTLGTSPSTSQPKPRNPLSSMKIVGQQKFLRDRGFDLQVDGIEGPLTRAARKAFLNNVPSSTWNKVHGSTPPATTPAAAPTAAPPGPTATSAPRPPAKPPSKVPPKGGTKPSGSQVPKKSPGVPPIDPQAAADAAASAQYDPQIAGYDFAVKTYKQQMQDAMNNLHDWTNQVKGSFNTYTPKVDQAYQNAIDNTQAMDAGISGLFGGSTGAEAAYRAAPQLDLLNALKAGDTAFSGNMQGVFDAQGRDYARRAQSEINNLIAKALVDRQAAVAAKGQATASNLYTYGQDAIKNAQAQQALDQAAALAPSQIKIAKAQADAARSDATTAAANASVAKTVAQQKLQASKIALRQQILENKKLAREANGQLNLSDPTVIAGITKSIRSSFSGPKGGLSLRPDVALQNARSAAQSLGLPMARLEGLIQNELAAALRISHVKGQWTAWKLVNGKLVLDQKLAAKNAKAAKKP